VHYQQRLLGEKVRGAGRGIICDRGKKGITCLQKATKSVPLTGHPKPTCLKEEGSHRANKRCRGEKNLRKCSRFRMKKGIARKELGLKPRQREEG